MSMRRQMFLAALVFFGLGAGSAAANKLGIMNCSNQRITVCVYNGSDPVTKYSVVRQQVKMGHDGYSTSLKCGGKKCRVKIVKGGRPCKTKGQGKILLAPKGLGRGSYILKGKNNIKKVSSSRKYFRDPKHNTCAKNK